MESVPLSTMSKSAVATLGSFNSSMEQGMPLCIALVVPDGLKLMCILQKSLCKQKQHVAFNVVAPRDKGSADLFSVKCSEHGERPSITLQTLKSTGSSEI